MDSVGCLLPPVISKMKIVLALICIHWATAVRCEPVRSRESTTAVGNFLAAFLLVSLDACSMDLTKVSLFDTAAAVAVVSCYISRFQRYGL